MMARLMSVEVCARSDPTFPRGQLELPRKDGSLRQVRYLGYLTQLNAADEADAAHRALN
jgi:hypothetical protein